MLDNIFFQRFTVNCFPTFFWNISNCIIYLKSK
nr:MAG TPA: hypothetical protein [Caudoviricetes sp.]